MKRISVVLALAAVAGCAGGTGSEGVEKPSGQKAVAAAGPALREPLAVDHAATVDGRALVVYKAKPVERQWIPCYQLRDAATGKVLLETDYHEIRLVPGVGVLVYPAEARTWSDGRGERLKELLRNYRQSPRMWQYKQYGERPIPHWQRFDPATGTRSETDIFAAESHYKDRKDDEALPAPLREPSHLIVRDLGVVENRGRLRAETYAPTGELLGRFDDFAPPGQTINRESVSNQAYFLQGRGRFSLISTFTPDGYRKDYLLGRLLETLEELPARAVEVRAILPRDLMRRVTPTQSYLAMLAPGTTIEEDLWVFLQPDGRFGAPKGIVGFKPIPDALEKKSPAEYLANAERRDVGHWFVRYAVPGEPAYVGDEKEPAGDRPRWGYASADMTEMTEAQWHEALILRAALSSYEEGFWQVVRNGNQWEAYGAGVKRSEASRMGGHGKTAGEALAMAQARTVASWAKYQADSERAAKQVEESRRQRKLHEDWDYAVRARSAALMGQLIWQIGGDDNWYLYAKSVPNPSFGLLMQAADQIKDPARSGELRRLAESRQKEATEAFARYAQIQQAPPVAPAGSSSGTNFGPGPQSMQFSNPEIYRYRMKTYGSFQPMLWDP